MRTCLSWEDAVDLQLGLQVPGMWLLLLHAEKCSCFPLLILERFFPTHRTWLLRLQGLQGNWTQHRFWSSQLALEGKA